MGWHGMEQDELECDGMGWDDMELDELEWDGMR